MKAGAWGVCTKYANTSGVVGPTTFCTPVSSGYTFSFALNTSVGGVNQFPLVADSATLLGQTSTNAIPILSSSQTSKFWLHPVAAVLALLNVASLILPPAYLGRPESFLHRVQKSGGITIVLGVLAFLVAFATFCVDLAVMIPARNALNAIPGIHCKLGNIQWFTLPSALIMLPAFASVLMTPSPPKYVDVAMQGA